MLTWLIFAGPVTYYCQQIHHFKAFNHYRKCFIDWYTTVTIHWYIDASILNLQYQYTLWNIMHCNALMHHSIIPSLHHYLLIDLGADTHLHISTQTDFPDKSNFEKPGVCRPVHAWLQMLSTYLACLDYKVGVQMHSENEQFAITCTPRAMKLIFSNAAENRYYWCVRWLSKTINKP